MGAGSSFSTGGGSGRGYAGQREAGYGAGYSGQGRGSYGGRGGFGSDDFAQEAYGQGFSGNEGRGFGYGSDYGRGGRSTYGGGGYGGGDYGREGQGQRDRGRERGLWERASDEVASWFGDRDAERRREQDYRGRGPKGYRRSDDRVREDVNDRLSDDSYVDASDIDVSVSNGEVTLSGTVDSRSARRRAEDIAENVSGVSYVQNNIRVQQTGSTSSSTQSLGTGTTTGVSPTGSIGTTGTGMGTGSGTGSSGTTGRS
jgi:osmotically-inducible protein OsmY